MGLEVAYEFEDGRLDVELIFVSSGKLENSELSKSEKINRSTFSIKRKNLSLSIFVSSVEKITVRSNKKTNQRVEANHYLKILENLDLSKFEIPDRSILFLNHRVELEPYSQNHFTKLKPRETILRSSDHSPCLPAICEYRFSYLLFRILFVIYILHLCRRRINFS